VEIPGSPDHYSKKSLWISVHLCIMQMESGVFALIAKKRLLVGHPYGFVFGIA